MDNKVEVYNNDKIVVYLYTDEEDNRDVETINQIVDNAKRDMQKCFENDREKLYKGLIKYAYDFMSEVEDFDPDEKLTIEKIKENLSGEKGEYYWEMANLDKKEDILNHLYPFTIGILTDCDVSDALENNQYVLEGNCDWEREHGVGLIIVDGKLKLVSSFDIGHARKIDSKFNYLIDENYPDDEFLKNEILLSKTYKRLFDL